MDYQNILIKRKDVDWWTVFFYGIPLFFLFLSILIINIYYFNSGLLTPDFSIIFKSYKLNLDLFPNTLIVISIFYLILFLFSRYKYIAFFYGLIASLLSISLFSLKYYVTHVEPTMLVIKEEVIYSTKIKRPIKLVHFSDIQTNKVSFYEQKIFDQIKSVNPDIIFYTGDFLQLEKGVDFKFEWNKLRLLFKEIKPKWGIYAVYGDTELELYYLKENLISPINILSSKTINIIDEDVNLSIHGLSLFQSKNPDWAFRSISKWLSSTKDSSFNILLGHSPDFSISVKQSNVDLCLAGHTHGGQVRLPILGPLVIDSNIPKDLSSGLHKIGNPYLNVSAGAGSNRYGGLPPIRFNCPTEFTVINILPLQ